MMFSSLLKVFFWNAAITVVLAFGSRYARRAVLLMYPSKRPFSSSVLSYEGGTQSSSNWTASTKTFVRRPLPRGAGTGAGAGSSSSSSLTFPPAYSSSFAPVASSSFTSSGSSIVEYVDMLRRRISNRFPHRRVNASRERTRSATEPTALTVACRGFPLRRAISPKKFPTVSLSTRVSVHSAFEGFVGWFSTNHCASQLKGSSGSEMHI
mmetsp:Transcript_46260/g.94589  ORF Transcript_46260/g.94589 Transcript_46260/m.94589 type:complete len:209 (-) Transcript_46260:273-899(-)